jgi:hypothetical protein
MRGRSMVGKKRSRQAGQASFLVYAAGCQDGSVVLGIASGRAGAGRRVSVSDSQSIALLRGNGKNGRGDWESALLTIPPAAVAPDVAAG